MTQENGHRKGSLESLAKTGQAQRSPLRNQPPGSSSLVIEEWRRYTVLQKVLKLWNWNWLIYRKRFEGPSSEGESKRRKTVGRLSEFIHLKKKKKKKKKKEKHLSYFQEKKPIREVVIKWKLNLAKSNKFFFEKGLDIYLQIEEEWSF